MRKVLVLGILLVAAPMAMGQGMDLTVLGAPTVSIDINTGVTLPHNFNADLNSTGMINPLEMALIGYECNLDEAGGVTTFDVTNTHNAAAGWATTGMGVRNVVDDLLDISTLDTAEAGAQIASSNATGAWGIGKLADIEITILAGAKVGTYLITPTSASYIGMMSGAPYPAAPVGALTVHLTPEPTTALLLLAGLPFLRRRRA